MNDESEIEVTDVDVDRIGGTEGVRARFAVEVTAESYAEVMGITSDLLRVIEAVQEIDGMARSLPNAQQLVEGGEPGEANISGVDDANHSEDNEASQRPREGLDKATKADIESGVEDITRDGNVTRIERWLSDDDYLRMQVEYDNGRVETGRFTPDNYSYMLLWLFSLDTYDNGPTTIRDVGERFVTVIPDYDGGDTTHSSMSGSVTDLRRAGLLSEAGTRDTRGQPKVYTVHERGRQYLKYHGSPTGDYKLPDALANRRDHLHEREDEDE